MDPVKLGAAFIVLAAIVCGVELAIAYLVAAAHADDDGGWSPRD
jgi:hypothetical protein